MKKTIIKYLVIFIVGVFLVLAARFGITSTNTKPDNTSPTFNLFETTVQSTSELEKVEVDYVIDGDTACFKTSDDQHIKVRFIGCNTPESVHSTESKNCKEGKIASEHTKEILYKGRTVYLEYDTEKTDKYGRNLAYVWLSDKVDTDDPEDMKKYMYNAQLILDGYAETMFVYPNYSHKSNFIEFENYAKEHDKGFWKNNTFDNHTELKAD